MKEAGLIRKDPMKKILDKYGIIAVLIGMVIIISIAKPQFMSSSNLFNVLSQACVYGIIALAQTYIIVSGGIDLSAAAIVAFAGVIGAAVGQNGDVAHKVLPWLPEMNFIVPVLVAIIIGIVCGLFNGLLIAKAGIPAFIATLGMTTLVRGLSLLFTKGQPVSNLIDAYQVVGSKLFNVVPVPVLIFAAAIIFSWILLKRTRFGMEVYAIGNSPRACRVAGVRLSMGLIKIYALSGLLYGIASVVLASRTQSVHPGAAAGYELTAIAACIIGGTSPMGGIGTIWGTIIGALIISVLRNALTILGVDPYMQQIAEGAIIVIAVYIDIRRGTRNI